MWQRVQTLYLAIAFALTGFLFFCNKAVVPGADGEIEQAYTYVQYTPYLILLIITTLLNFLAVTTYKIRVFQMRTAAFSALITIALQAWLLVDFFLNKNDMVFKVTLLFPVISVIFQVLAYRSIMADELIVQSSSRLRAAKRKSSK